MGFDEFYFHERREIPRWERIGHPLDTLTTLMPLTIAALYPYNSFNFKIFLILAIFSCLFITKDEFVHSDYCSKMEHWLHSMLFIVHPVIFMTTFVLWTQTYDSIFLKIQPLLILGFMLYQITRWNILWPLSKK